MIGWVLPMSLALEWLYYYGNVQSLISRSTLHTALIASFRTGGLLTRIHCSFWGLSGQARICGLIKFQTGG